jgi:hypothetical protein
MKQEKRGKDRAKHDGGKDASGTVPDGAKHPESEHPWRQPESGTPGSDREPPARKQDRQEIEETNR